MKQDIIDSYTEQGFIYCESYYRNNPNPICQEIERELVRFNWSNKEFRGHFKVYQGVHYFDEIVMGEIRFMIDEYNRKLKEGLLHERI